MKTFVTGATGFIGASIVRELLKDGREVRALVRAGSDTSNLAGLDIELWQGDLLDRDSLRQGLKGCDALYHAAADYRLWTRNPQQMYRHQRRRHLGCSGCSLGKLPFTGGLYQQRGHPGQSRRRHAGSGRYAGDPGRHGRALQKEQVPGGAGGGEVSSPADCTWSSSIRQRRSEPLDIKPTPTGKIIVDFLNRKMPAYLDTGLNIIAVEDCARGHILAERKGRWAKNTSWATPT